MNRESLKIKLDELNISKSLYSLDGEAGIEKRILQKGGGRNGCWVIYETDERGNKYNIKEFYLETDACEYFYQQMKKGKEREDRINQLPSFQPSFQKKNIFIVSDTGEVKVQKDD